MVSLPMQEQRDLLELLVESDVDVEELGELFLARCCLGQVPGGAPFSQRSELATYTIPAVGMGPRRGRQV